MDKSCQLALRQLLPDKQLIFMTDASFQAAGFAVLIEGDPNHIYKSTCKTYSLLLQSTVQRRTHCPKSKCASTQKKFSLFFGFQRIWTYTLGCDQTSDYYDRQQINQQVLPDKIDSSTLMGSLRFHIFKLQINLTIEHIRGKMNTAADSLSGLEMDPIEKISLKIREEFSKKPIEVNIESTGIEQEELVFLDNTGQHETTEK